MAWKKHSGIEKEKRLADYLRRGSSTDRKQLSVAVSLWAATPLWTAAATPAAAASLRSYLASTLALACWRWADKCVVDLDCLVK